MSFGILLILLLTSTGLIRPNQAFDVRHHLATVTRYDVVKDIVDNSFIPSNVPDQCSPIHLNLLARHGTRSPTKKKMRSLEALSDRMETLLQAAKEHKLSLQKIPSWLWGWKSPWKGKLKGGELVSEGETELYNLGSRIRKSFPEIFRDDYHPDVYTIKATQAFRKSREPDVDKLKRPILDEITNSLVQRYGLNFSRQDTSSLWFLCKQEASLLGKPDQACGMFTPSEVALLEWTDDLELFILKGYGNALNYRMGVPLLEDVIQSMEQAIKSNEENQTPGSYEKARLRFAHAETLLPFSCLIGLFLEGPEFELIRSEQALQLPPKPPQLRKWRGSIAAPFGGNNMLVLYSCSANSSSKYLVQVLHNEHPVPLPGCDNSNICPFEVFKEKIVAPHLKHDYNKVCNMLSEEVPEQNFLMFKLKQMFSWLFSPQSSGFYQ